MNDSGLLIPLPGMLIGVILFPHTLLSVCLAWKFFVAGSVFLFCLPCEWALYGLSNEQGS